MWILRFGTGTVPCHSAWETIATVPTTLHHCCESLRIVAHLLVPFLPATAKEIFSRLGLDGAPRPDDPTAFGGLPAGLDTRKGDPLFPRVEGGLPGVEEAG